MATVKENLIAAKALIDTPEKWKDKGAYNALDFATSAANGGTDFQFVTAAEAVREQLVGTQSIQGFNDRATHADVMALFDRAIAAQDA